MSVDKKVRGINGVELPMTMQTYEENQFITKKEWHLQQIATGHSDNMSDLHFENLKKFFGVTDEEIAAARVKRDLNRTLYGI